MGNQPGGRVRAGGGGRSNRPWRLAVARYVAYRRAQGGIGASWLRRIDWELSRTPRLLVRVGIVDPVREPAEIRAEHLLALTERLGWAAASLRLHYAALRPFLSWVGNPVARGAAAWKVPSGNASRRRWLTKEQFGALLRASRGRERLLVTLEGLNGLRRIEVLRLRHRDVHRVEGLLNVHGKGRDGGKWRQVPICPVLSRLLAQPTPEEGGESHVLPLSASGADLLLKRAARRARFPEKGLRVSHHDLRRTFGRLSHDAGMDLIQLKNLYGHSSIDQTVHYIGLDQAEMRRGLDRLDLMLRPLLSGRTRSRAERERGRSARASGR